MSIISSHKELSQPGGEFADHRFRNSPKLAHSLPRYVVAPFIETNSDFVLEWHWKWTLPVRVLARFFAGKARNGLCVSNKAVKFCSRQHVIFTKVVSIIATHLVRSAIRKLKPYPTFPVPVTETIEIVSGSIVARKGMPLGLTWFAAT